MDRMGVKLDRFGDASDRLTGVLNRLSVFTVESPMGRARLNVAFRFSMRHDMQGRYEPSRA